MCIVFVRYFETDMHDILFYKNGNIGSIYLVNMETCESFTTHSSQCITIVFVLGSTKVQYTYVTWTENKCQ